jgi:transposase
LRVVSEWATRRRRARVRPAAAKGAIGPKDRTTDDNSARDHLSKADTVVIAAIEAGAPMLVKARDLIDRFPAMIRKKTEADLEPWIADADTSLLASFARGIRRDHAAVRAAIAEPWSNGQTEGQITRLKLV